MNETAKAVLNTVLIMGLFMACGSWVSNCVGDSWVAAKEDSIRHSQKLDSFKLKGVQYPPTKIVQIDGWEYLCEDGTIWHKRWDMFFEMKDEVWAQ